MRDGLTLPRLRLTPAVQAAALAAGVTGTFALADQLAAGQLKLLEATVAVAGLALAFRWTRQAVYVWVALTATVLPSRIFPISVGGVRSDLPEAFAFAVMALVIVRWAMGDRLRRPRISGPLLLLATAAFIGAAVASSHGAGRDMWLGPLKSLLLYLLPLAAVALHRNVSDVDALERWVLRIATAGTVGAFLSFASGISTGTLSRNQVVTLGLTSDANRLRPAVLNLLVLAVLLLLARCVHHGLTWSRVLGLVLYATLIAMSFTRSTWVPLGLAILLFVLGRPGARVPLRGLRTGITIFAIAIAAFATAASGMLGPSMKAVTVRVESVGNPQVFQENSYQDRANEDTIAWTALKGHHLQGIGLGRPYGDVVIEHDPITGKTVREPRRFIHNSYLATWLGLGVLGLLAWAWLGVSVTRHAVLARRDTSEHGTRAFAAGCAILALGLEAIFQTHLYNRSVLATITCAIVLLLGAPRPAPDTP